ncbi:uroporphyrin-III C-methyltransferase [Lonsdalea populi]|uniref:uroporphyrinogen-III C-methyltransferase n=1 Tax=Lonsdalea populi TaxID=1172565 RepID=A0A3N0UC60_9GAMM|nr:MULTISPECIES: uroporphyrinogen-III C-methyltransferase [Lonsdalea]RAT14605.1 uroporphyrin-III C-methyltransferase [Lonsdalea quercina]RAT28390.1 uroporphyrin-III C-methyltransferase [Lonsdalea populi]RAT34210.1 uroporphyrin-III C-methyltransferase [Lonsdalea populi]RAT47402.1 uroporphyrin-III C-methyltransferase [Lonsdalea populi]RAT53479.1 uroporphyrin-III C-methyltransferase [Lonsdalea populi]
MNTLDKTSPMQQLISSFVQIMSIANQQNPVTGGEVWLVGAGPGDVELLTLKALRVIRQADVVVFDRLVSEAIMALIPPRALRIDVGKSTRNHTLGQDEINQLLVTLAQGGKKVVRLKGGDPFVFGRGGEEIVYSQQHGVACHVVPGITAAIGCAAASGIPLTHRRMAQSVRFVTGYSAQGEPEPDWPTLAAERQTLVFYMGIANCSRISEQLIAHGLGAATSVAVIERGTQPKQRVIVGRLDLLTKMVVINQVKSPALLIVGDVVSLYKREGQRRFSKGEPKGSQLQGVNAII